MNRSFSDRISAVAFLSVIAFITAHSQNESPTKPFSPSKSLGLPNTTLSNINNVAAWYSSNGEQEHDRVTGNSGLIFPRGTARAIYQAGIIWGGNFNDGQTPALRVNGQTYSAGTKPGRILGIRTGNAEDPNAPDVRIWRIRRDYATADLTQDAAEYFRVNILYVTPQMIDSVRNQYARDWQEWPWQKGAPFYDTNENGTKDSTEEPGLAGAHHVVWYVCNDIGVTQPYSCPESGIEQQTTIWAYNRTNPLANVIFKRFRIFFKGIASTPANATIDSMYFCHWSDPDVGLSTNDFAGSDSIRSISYAYNGTPTDADYDVYGLRPPAIGYDLLQGPIVITGNPLDTAIVNFKKMANARNVPMYAAIHFTAGGIISDPPFNYSGAIQWYALMRGLIPSTGQCRINPITGQCSRFWLNGDPVTATGWLDGVEEGPGDRRILLSSGPFSMAVGDSQEIVVATVAGIGASYLQSITIMRANDLAAQQLFDSLANFVITDVADDDRRLPTKFALLQNYPNPFNPSTVIRYQLPVSSYVTLRVYDILGGDVSVLVDDYMAAGDHEAIFDASSLASGVYFYRIQATGLSGAGFSHIQTNKMVLMK